MRSSRGRLAPSPTGYLHLGHARTSWVAQERVRREGGVLVLRHEDLDHDRCTPEFVRAMFDDHAMQISEVVRGEDLLRSTARQLLLYAALGWAPPAFYHCPLVRDENGVRLAKRHAALSLGALRARGLTPQALRQGWST